MYLIMKFIKNEYIFYNILFTVLNKFTSYTILHDLATMETADYSQFVQNSIEIRTYVKNVVLTPLYSYLLFLLMTMYFQEYALRKCHFYFISV